MARWENFARDKQSRERDSDYNFSPKSRPGIAEENRKVHSRRRFLPECGLDSGFSQNEFIHRMRQLASMKYLLQDSIVGVLRKRVGDVVGSTNETKIVHLETAIRLSDDREIYEQALLSDTLVLRHRREEVVAVRKDIQWDAAFQYLLLYFSERICDIKHCPRRRLLPQQEQNWLHVGIFEKTDVKDDSSRARLVVRLRLPSENSCPHYHLTKHLRMRPGTCLSTQVRGIVELYQMSSEERKLLC
jgi:hypothetical protein